MHEFFGFRFKAKGLNVSDKLLGI